MNSKNKILVGCLALLLALSVGYALFSDTITINGTASAKGDFAYEITTMKSVDASINSSEMYGVYYSDEPGSVHFSNYSDETGVSESSISSEGNVITYQASFSKPTEIQYFTVKITNTGSIPITTDFWNEFTYNYNNSGTITLVDNSVINIEDIEKMTQNAMSKPFGLSTVDYMNLKNIPEVSFLEVYISKDSYDELYEELETNDNALPILETGESLYIVFKTSWPDKSLNENIIGADLTSTLNITIPIKQIIVQ